ncbi:MAG TPA: hypothetical protein VGY55_10035 [Pirellulales bacterium]|jgi:hypothetical protein|nr:hypothetical protein [Pirellulales bacterium]
MRKIVFQFQGGFMDGRSIEGGENRSLSAAHLDPVLSHWFDTQFGTVGRMFVVAQPNSPRKCLYEVMARVESDDKTVVEARYARTGHESP